MKRGAPMKRTPFKRKSPAYVERVRAPLALIPPAAWREAAPVDGQVRAVAKDEPLQHQGYMAAVRRLPCAHCGAVGFTQFCHADEGKGAGLKTDCRRGWPGCGPHGDTMGCHYLLGSTGKLGRDERRRLEALYARQARAAVRALGQWPASLPAWPGDEAANDSPTNDARTA